MIRAAPEELEALVDLALGRRLVALTGAGLSTESGIPDYRGPETARRARNPIQYRQFLADPASRRRYWARSTIGWQRVHSARPNEGHRALAELEADGKLAGLITQNVDGLHLAAGSQRVVELHGSLWRVRCLECRQAIARSSFQSRLLEANPLWDTRSVESAPDGDAELEVMTDGFRVPDCDRCGGIYKPDVVFFGESVPSPIVEEAWSIFDDAEVLLIAGSSLAVFSGYRFALRARERGLPIAIVNLGATRASELAVICIDASTGDVLPRLRAKLAKADARAPWE